MNLAVLVCTLGVLYNFQIQWQASCASIKFNGRTRMVSELNVPDEGNALRTVEGSDIVKGIKVIAELIDKINNVIQALVKIIPDGNSSSNATMLEKLGEAFGHAKNITESVSELKEAAKDVDKQIGRNDSKSTV